MLENETAARQGGRNPNGQVEGEHTESSAPRPDLQDRQRCAKIARALRIRIQHILQERVDKAQYVLSLEQWCHAEQQRVLDELFLDNLTLSRMRSAVHRLEFEVAP